MTLYEKVGGEEAIDAVVTEFYQRVFADPELSPFFEGIDAERLRCMQREYFARALDGPSEYTGRSLREAHAGLGIRPRHLTRFVDHLMAVLEQQGLDEKDRYEVCTRINLLAEEITGDTTVDG